MSDAIAPDPRMTNAMDFAGLAQMRAGALRGNEKVTKEVAQQFESIFINMMLKSMLKHQFCYATLNPRKLQKWKRAEPTFGAD